MTSPELVSRTYYRARGEIPKPHLLKLAPCAEKEHHFPGAKIRKVPWPMYRKAQSMKLAQLGHAFAAKVHHQMGAKGRMVCGRAQHLPCVQGALPGTAQGFPAWGTRSTGAPSVCRSRHEQC